MFGDAETIVRDAEVMAVVRARRSGAAPRVGDTLDYTIDSLTGRKSGFGIRKSTLLKPYRFAVEPWHLEEADRLGMKLRTVL